MPQAKSGQNNRNSSKLPTKARSAAPEETDEQKRGAAGKFKARISPPMRDVIEVMAHEGIDLKTAAARSNITYSSAMRAMHRPHVKKAYNQLVMDVRTNAGQEAYLRLVHMSKTAESEHVRADTNKWVAGVDNIAPIKRVEGRVQVSHSFAGFTFGDDEAIEGEAIDARSGDDDG